MQTWYLHRCGLPVGPGVGLMTLQYVFHKTTVLLYATVMLLLQHRWLAANTSGVMRYLPAAYAWWRWSSWRWCCSVSRRWCSDWPAGCCFSAQNGTVAPPGKLAGAAEHPGHREPPPAGRQAPLCRILAVQTVKLFLLFCLPWFCIRFMGLSCGLSFWQVQLLTSLMLFLSNALPNVAGMGSIETAFLLVFSSFMTSGEAMSTLMLFRIASYYFVFAASAAGTFAAQNALENS